MRITWITSAELQPLGSTSATSDSAAARYRVLLPAQALQHAGHHVTVLSIARFDEAELHSALAVDVVVLSEASTPALVPLLADAQQRGTRVIVDVHHLPFITAPADGSARALLTAADAIVASSHTLAQRIEPIVGRRAIVIGDPFEGPAGDPEFAPAADVLKILWYGNRANFDTFVTAIPYLNAASTVQPVEVTAITSPIEGIEETFAEFNERSQFPIQLQFTPWSLAAMWNALQHTDIVVLPSAMSEEYQAESASRVIEALHAGRFVVAQPQPAHHELRNYVYLGQDLAAGITWALRNPQEAWTRLAQGQRAVGEDYSPIIIGKQWLKLFTDLRAQRPRLRDTRQLASPAVRLNLGCGNKRIPGYINVDIADDRAGVKPDVHCDVRKLDRFADDSVDEILSVHVVEYFWRWEVLDILREWVRVLKPGGRLAVECPNLLTACIEFVNDPDSAAGDGPEGQRTMWVFYGDPRWQDPLMVPRWGYTPQSLAKLMSQAGLINVHQDAAEYKLREPRDMRVVGEKPIPAN